MASRERLAEQIARNGVPFVFGIPGSGLSLELLDALERRGVPFHLCHFEGSAAMMAATVGHLTGRAGVAISIKGPGLVNLLPGLALAHFEGFPLVAIAEAYGVNTPPAVAHKRLDQSSLVAAVAKGVRGHADTGPSFAELASWAEAQEPGPVLLELRAGPDAPQDPIPLGPATVVTSGAEAVAERVGRSERPVVIAGALAVRLGLGATLESLSVPVLTSVAAKGLVDERRFPSAGVFTGAGGPLAPETVILRKADLVIGIGLQPKELLKTAPFSCAALDLGVGAPPGWQAFGLEMRAAPDALPMVIDALAGKRWGQELAMDAIAALDARLCQGFLPGAVFRALARILPSHTRLVMDTGSFCTVGEHVWKAPAASLSLLSAQGRYMGTGLPMGVAASLVDPERPTVTVVGDGGIGMYLSEVRLAIQAKAPLLLVLMTDGAFASIRTRALKDGLTQRPLRMTGGPWVPALEGLGMPGRYIRDETDLFDALTAWDPSGGPLFLEVAFDADRYEAMVHGVR